VTPLRPEEALVLACVRRSVDVTEGADLNARLAAVSDWDYALRIARYHQVVPLLHRLLVRERAPQLSPDRAESLQLRFDESATRARRLAGELIRVVERAGRDGVALMPFKGPVLATEVYGSLTARQFDDLDLLVDPAQSGRAEQLLGTLGYRPRKDFGYEVKFVHQDHGSTIDLHRELSSRAFPAPLPFDRLWSRRITVSLDGHPVQTLSAADLFIALCLQAGRDGWLGRTRLAKICDIGQVMRSGPSLDWSRIADEAAFLRIRRLVEFGLGLARSVLRLPSSGLPAWGAHRRVNALVRQEEEALFDDRSSPPGGRVRGARMYFHLREDWRDKLHPYWWLRVVPGLRPIRDGIRTMTARPRRS
jgi:hypothetical protein